MRQSSGTVLINISEQKKMWNYTNMAASAKASFGSCFFTKKTLIKKRVFENFSRH